MYYIITSELRGANANDGGKQRAAGCPFISSNTLFCSHPHFSPTPSPPFPSLSSSFPFRYAHITPRAAVALMYVPPVVLISHQPDILFFIASSIVFACVAMGISISLLHVERPSMPPYTNVSQWQRPPDSSPNPNPNPNVTPRDDGIFIADTDDFRTSEILSLASSALNLLVAPAL